jgi:hypothetical protein
VHHLTLAFSLKCLLRFQRFHRIFRPNHRFQMTSSKGLSKVRLSLQILDELAIIGS